MNTNPIISVIIPCYNVARYLPDSVGSVINQTYRNVECIIVDDGSTDHTEQVVADLARNDNRIRYYKKENGGVSTARNYGVDRARGDYVQFLDADDWLNTEKFKYQIEYICKNNIQDKNIVLYSDFQIVWVDNNNVIIDKKIHTFKKMNNEELKKKILGRRFGLDEPTPLSVCNTLLSKNVVQQFKFNDKMTHYEEYDFFVRILNDDTSFYYTPGISFYYRQRKDSASKNKNLSRIGYLQLLESLYHIDKDMLVNIPNMNNILDHFYRNGNKEMLKRALFLIKNSTIPVYSLNNKNIRNKIVFLDAIKLYYPYLKLRNSPITVKKRMKSILGRIKRTVTNIPNKMLFRIGVYLHTMEDKIGAHTLPRFANKPEKLRIKLPRRIDNPENIYIGNEVSIGPGCLLKTVQQYPSNKKVAERMNIPLQKFFPKLVIGDRVSATASLQISALDEIIIEDDVMFASNIWICDGLHGYENVDLPYKYQPMFRIAPIKIGRGCWIGQNVVVMPGVTIGEMSIIGANSVVTSNIPERSIAMGTPARVMKRWDEQKKDWVKVTSTDK